MSGAQRKSADSQQEIRIGGFANPSLPQGTLEVWNRFLGDYFPFLRARFRARRVGEDDDLVDECLADALLALRDHSETWDPTRRTVRLHVFAKAQGLLANRLRSRRRRAKRERSVGVLDQDFQKYLKSNSVKTARVDFIEDVDQDEPLQTCFRDLSSRELREVALLRDCAPVAEWVRILELQDVAEPDRSWRVYREKDRLRRKLRRRMRRITEIRARDPPDRT
jgi:hypothetical protein